MAFPLLLAALAISAVGFWAKGRRPVLGQALMGLGGLGLIGVIALQIRQNLMTPEPAPPNRRAIAVSYRLANCVLEDLGSQAGTVVLLFPDRRLMDSDTEQSYEDGFQLPLRHARAKPHLKAIRLEAGNPAAGRDLAAFKQALAQAQDAAAVVSYAGVPAGFESLFPSGQPNVPAFYVFDAEGTTNWLGALKDGRIKAVVLPRPGTGARGQDAAPGPPDTTFQKLYLLATPASADQVAESLKAKN